MTRFLKYCPSLVAIAAASLLFSSAPIVANSPVEGTGIGNQATTGVPGWGIASKDLPGDPDVVFGTLPNGMRYAIKRHQSPKGAVSVRFGIDAGTKDESDAQRGAAHFVEHMAFNGSRNIPEGKLVPMLERLGLSFGADTNAETGFDHTTYKLDLPNAKVETLDAALLMMREVAGRLTIAPGAVDRERGILVSEASVRNDANRRRLANVLNTEFPGNRLGGAVPADPDQIRKITAKDLRAFYQAFYRPENSTLVIVGDVDPAEMQRKITAAFGGWKPMGKAGRDYRGPVSQPKGPIIGSFTDPAIAEIVMFERARAYAAPANSVDEERRKLLETIAGAAISNRFQAIAQTPKSPILGALFQRQDIARNASTFGLYVIARDGNWSEALAIGEQEMRRANQHGFTASEVDEIKANYLSLLTNAVAQQAGRSNASIAEALAAQSFENAVFTSPDFDLASYNSIVQSINSESVTAAFREAWQGGPTLVHVSAKSAIDNPAPAITTLLDASSRVAVTAPTEAVTKAFAYDSFGTPGTVVSDKRIADLGIRTVTFANGLQLNLKRTDWAAGKVSFSMDVGQGTTAFPVDKPGLFIAANLLMPADGLKAHDATELRKIVAGHQVSLGLGVTNDALTASGAVAAKDLDLQLKLLAAQVSAAGFRPETAAQWGPAAQTIGQAWSAQPIQVWSMAQNYVLTGGDGRFGVPTPAALSKLTFDDMEAVVAPQLANGPVSLALVGDFDEEAVVAAVGRTLGALPSRAPRKHIAYTGHPLAFKASGTTTLTHTGQANQGAISISWPTTDDHDLKDSLTRELLAQAMSLKALDLVREKLGATYTPKGVSFTQSIYPGYGHITLFATSAPGDMDRIDQAFRQIAAEMSAGLIGADLLNRAREPVLSGYARGNVLNEGWAGLVNYAQSWPERLDRRRQREAVLRSITPADIQAAAKRYLVDRKAAAIRVVPASTNAVRS
ncbi:MAG: insulinase family protein [Novosphingobium sp.]|uniref:M16 family metallopeptidase n=1 Tax=Novosphingobium sp. TaxID=1874826 RepID=UPI0032BAD1D3